MHLFDEEISADERKLLPNEGIWDIKAEQILYNVVELRGLSAKARIAEKEELGGGNK